jgi:hypothetical protein
LCFILFRNFWSVMKLLILPYRTYQVSRVAECINEIPQEDHQIYRQNKWLHMHFTKSGIKLREKQRWKDRWFLLPHLVTTAEIGPIFIEKLKFENKYTMNWEHWVGVGLMACTNYCLVWALQSSRKSKGSFPILCANLHL